MTERDAGPASTDDRTGTSVSTVGARAAGLRVVAILPSDDFTGPAGQVASTAVELSRLGVDVRFLLLSRRGSRTGRLAAFLTHYQLRHALIEDRGPLDPRLPGRVRSLLREWRPDILETHGYKATALACLLGLRPVPWRWVGFFHGATTESRRARVYHRLDRALLGRADCIVTISEDQRRRLFRSAERVRVVHSGVTLLEGWVTGGEASPVRGGRGLARPRIGVVGRLSPEKGVDVLLHAAAVLRSRLPDFTLMIAGDGPERAALERLAEVLELQDHAVFLGRVADMRSLYGELDLVVIPSRSEGLPSVLLEALAADLPVVATRVGAVPEVLTDPLAGLIVPPGSPRELAHAIESALARAAEPAARNARAAAAEAFSLPRRAASLAALYRQLSPGATTAA